MPIVNFTGIRSQFHIYFVPTQATVCMHLLEEKLSGSGGGGGSGSAWDKVSFGEFRMGLVPYDSDLLSLEMDHVFKQVSTIPIDYVDGRPCLIKHACTISFAL